MTKRSIETVKEELAEKKNALKGMSVNGELTSRDIRQFKSISERLEREPEKNGAMSDVTITINDTETKFSDVVKMVIAEHTKEIDAETKTKISEIKKEIKDLETELIQMVTSE